MNKRDDLKITQSLWVNTDTGEQRQVVETMKPLKTSRKGFVKVWLLEVCQILTKIGGKRLLVFENLIDKLDKRTNHIYIDSINKFAKEINVSKSICYTTIKILVDSSMLVEVGSGMYMLNPKLVTTATEGKETALLIKFDKEVENSTDE